MIKWYTNWFSFTSVCVIYQRQQDIFFKRWSDNDCPIKHEARSLSAQRYMINIDRFLIFVPLRTKIWYWFTLEYPKSNLGFIFFEVSFMFVKDSSWQVIYQDTWLGNLLKTWALYEVIVGNQYLYYECSDKELNHGQSLHKIQILGRLS